MAQLVKNPPAMWETWVQSLGWEDPLEKGKTTHASILAWRRVAKSWTRLSDFNSLHFHAVIPYLLSLPGLVSSVVRIKVCRRPGFSSS